jgi:hypothetical protein
MKAIMNKLNAIFSNFISAETILSTVAFILSTISILYSMNDKQLNQDILSNIAFPILTTVLISSLTLILRNFYLSYEMVKKYYKYTGDYVNESYRNEYEHTNIHNPLETISNGSTSIIKYINANNLEITVTDKNKNIWVGKIELPNEKVGAVAWEYTNLKDRVDHTEWKESGYKKLIIIDLNRIILFSSNSTNDKKYGREILIRQNPKPN